MLPQRTNRACPTLAQLQPVYVRFNLPEDKRQSALIILDEITHPNELITAATDELNRALETYWTPNNANRDNLPRAYPTFAQDSVTDRYTQALKIDKRGAYHAPLMRKLVALAGPRFIAGARVRVMESPYRDPMVTLSTFGDQTDGAELYEAFLPLKGTERLGAKVTAVRFNGAHSAVEIQFPKRDADDDGLLNMDIVMHAIRELSPIYLDTKREV